MCTRIYKFLTKWLLIKSPEDIEPELYLVYITERKHWDSTKNNKNCSNKENQRNTNTLCLKRQALLQQQQKQHNISNKQISPLKRVSSEETDRDRSVTVSVDDSRKTDAEEWECLCSGSFHQQTAAKQKKRHFHQLQLEQKTQTQRDCLSSGVCVCVCVFMETNNTWWRWRRRRRRVSLNFKSLNKLLPAAKHLPLPHLFVYLWLLCIFFLSLCGGFVSLSWFFVSLLWFCISLLSLFEWFKIMILLKWA